MNEASDPSTRLTRALSVENSSDRLQAALTAGTHPDDAFLEPLIDRCTVEPDFYVRDMLTWALTRLPLELVLPRVIEEAASETPQARSQALHTLSKLGDERGWSAITAVNLHDPDDEVARAAWRTASGLVPEGGQAELAGEFARELGRGDLAVMRSLSRAFVELGEHAVSALRAATIEADSDSAVARHARASLRLIEDPDATFVLE